MTVGILGQRDRLPLNAIDITPPLSDAGKASSGPIRFSKTFPVLFLALAG